MGIVAAFGVYAELYLASVWHNFQDVIVFVAWCVVEMRNGEVDGTFFG